MVDKDKTKEVAKVAPPQLPAIPDPKELEELFKEFEGVQPSFSTIKIPTGGSLAWEIPGEEEPVVAKEFLGVILDHYPTRVYWPGDFEGGNAPPECSSLDGRTGFKYGECAKCQYSQWGSGKKGRGQACKSVHRVYILLAGSESIFPYLIPFPPTSAPQRGGYEGSLPTYLTKIVGKLKKPSGVWTKFKLIKDKNPEGIEYGKVQCFLGGDLTDTEKKTVTFLKENLRTAMREKPFETAEYDTGGNEEETRGEETRGTEQREVNRENSSGGPDPWDKKRGDDIPF